MLDKAGFDLWADEYDADTQTTDEDNRYPFAGYRRVLNEIYNRVRRAGAKHILDIGFGTGKLASRLYRDGCTVTGVDFSQRMISIAEKQMPGAILIQHDFSTGLPEVLRNQRFDAILCTYALHHLTDEDKLRVLREWMGCLLPAGKILLGDVAFFDRTALERCRVESGEEWDNEEFYLVTEELKRTFPQASFLPCSTCAGVVELKNEPLPQIHQKEGIL